MPPSRQQHRQLLVKPSTWRPKLWRGWIRDWWRDDRPSTPLGFTAYLTILVIDGSIIAAVYWADDPWAALANALQLAGSALLAPVIHDLIVVQNPSASEHKEVTGATEPPSATPITELPTDPDPDAPPESPLADEPKVGPVDDPVALPDKPRKWLRWPALALSLAGLAVLVFNDPLTLPLWAILAQIASLVAISAGTLIALRRSEEWVTKTPPRQPKSRHLRIKLGNAIRAPRRNPASSIVIACLVVSTSFALIRLGAPDTVATTAVALTMLAVAFIPAALIGTLLPRRYVVSLPADLKPETPLDAGRWILDHRTTRFVGWSGISVLLAGYVVALTTSLV